MISIAYEVKSVERGGGGGGGGLFLVGIGKPNRRGSVFFVVVG